MNRYQSLSKTVLVPAIIATFGFLSTAHGQAPARSHQIIVPRIASSRTQIQEPEIAPADPAAQSPQFSPASQDADNLRTRQREARMGKSEQEILKLFEMGKWPRKDIQKIKIDIRETNAVSPADASGKLMESAEGRWGAFQPTPKVFAWAAPDIRYQPLYFEEVALERYGQTTGPYTQTARSAVHFFTSFVFLPYQMHHDHPCECDYPLGFCRPGNDVPYTIQRHYYGRK